MDPRQDALEMLALTPPDHVVIRGQPGVLLYPEAFNPFKIARSALHRFLHERGEDGTVESALATIRRLIHEVGATPFLTNHYDKLTAAYGVIDAALRSRLVSELETRPVLAEVHAERLRQDAKWGEQNHPVIDFVSALGMKTLREEAREECDYWAARGHCTWYNILKEEFYEAFAEGTPEGQRAELLQVAAVAVAIIECIDRRAALAARAGKEGGSPS
jgi:hypothetical protein